MPVLMRFYYSHRSSFSEEFSLIFPIMIIVRFSCTPGARFSEEFI